MSMTLILLQHYINTTYNRGVYVLSALTLAFLFYFFWSSNGRSFYFIFVDFFLILMSIKCVVNHHILYAYSLYTFFSFPVEI